MVRLQMGALVLALLGVLSHPMLVAAAPGSFDIDVKELDQGKPAPPKAKEPKVQKAPQKAAPASKPHPPAHAAPKAAHSGDGYIRYTVKPGDHLFKILMVDFGMSNEKAEHLIPEILRINDIGSIRSLKVGSVILIPREGTPRAAAAASRKKAHQKKEQSATSQKAEEPAKVQKKEEAVAAGKKEEPVARKDEPIVKKEELPEPHRKKEPAEASQPKKEEPVPALSAVAPPPAKPELPPPPPVAAPAPAPAAGAHPQHQAPAALRQEPTVSKAAPPPPAPAPEVKKEAPAPPPRQSIMVAAPVQPPTWICSIPEKDPHRILDSMMNVLSLKWAKNRIVRSEDGAKTAFSVMVDRYFELKGKRYIVTVGEIDPYNYTLLRLLETSGYKVLRLNGGEDFEAVGDKLLRLVGSTPAFGKHALAGDGEKKGFLLTEDETGGRRVLVTREVVGPGEERVMAAGCGSIQ